MRADTRKHGGILLGILAVAIAVAAAVSALTTGADSGSASGGSGATTPMHMDHGSHPPSVHRGAPGPGVAAPPFDVARLDGPGRIRLADYAGRPVVLTFWASWCISCRTEFPRLTHLVADHHGTDLAVIGITYRDLADDARAFADRMRANFTLAKGGDGDPVAARYGIRAIPQLYFIDRDGVIRQRIFGSPRPKAISAAVDAISRR